MNLIKPVKPDLKGHFGKIIELQKKIEEADTVIIGAGAGLSTSAGYIYSGELFEKYFSDFHEKYGFEDMYSGGFYPFPDETILWAFWSRMIWLNRYTDTPKPVYEELLELVKDKDYFVITTNVDHCFQKAGIDRSRLFYTQGDYGLFQVADGDIPRTFDNREIVKAMLEAQGFVIGEDNELIIPEGVTLKMEIPAELIPYSDEYGQKLTMNLRSDDTFVEDSGWYLASQRYMDFLRSHVQTKTLFLELGVGYNTPVIIKYPFQNMTEQWPDAFYAIINKGQAYVPEEIREKSLAIDADIGSVIHTLAKHAE